MDVAHTVEHLTASVVAHGVREREAGVARPEPPEGVLEHLRRLDPAAADEAVRRFHVAWTRVAPQDVGTVVADVAERALWDVVAAQVRDEGNFEGLFGLLEELRGAVRALIAHSERGVADLDDIFDVAFLKQQADHGALTLVDVGNLMRYLVDTVGRMHAPADDADVEAWRRATDAAIDAGRDDDLATFAHARLLPFLKATLHRVRAVYARVVAFGEELARSAERGA